MEFIKAFHKLLFPSENLCFFCKDRSSPIKDYICQACRESLEILNKEIVIDSTYLDELYYTMPYNKRARELIQEYKFHGKSYLSKPLGQLMLKTMEHHRLEADLIFYIPSHRRKEAIRGYNQSQLLASYLAEKKDIALSQGNLIKVKNTEDQNKLQQIERLTNLKGAFSLKNAKEIEDKNILLIDDVYTTGTTMLECSSLLKRAGARKIIGLSLASSHKI